MSRMGLKDAWNAQMARHKSSVERTKAGVEGRYALVSDVRDGIFAATGVKKSVAGAVAEFESGAQQKNTTVTRVAAGAIIAGPVGAIVGGLFKKDKSRAYVTVMFPDGQVAIIDGPIKDEKQLRSYAQIINAAGRHYAIA